MIGMLAAAFGLGLTFNAAPGGVFAETVRQGIQGGFRSALAVQLGSLVGDAVWAFLGLLGVGLLLQAAWLSWPLGLAGAGYLLWLSWDAWRAASREFAVDAHSGDGASRALRAGVVLSMTNPQNIAFWAALGSALGTIGVSEPQPSDYMVFFAGFMAASVMWSFVCAALVDRVFANAGQRWARLTYRICAVAFLALALASLRDLARLPWHSEAREPNTSVTGQP